MNRNFIFSFLLFIFSIFIFSCKRNSCCGSESTGNWVSFSPTGALSPLGRTESVVFVIGNYAYIGTGIDNTNKRYNDFYRFDPTNSSWYQVATCYGMSPRNSAAAFVVNNKGYVGMGWDGSYALGDFWQYEPTTNSWSQKASIGDSSGFYPRYDAVAFGINDYGYVSTGNNGITLLRDFWKYDPSNDSWKKKSDFPGIAKSQAVSFVYNDRGYIVTGLDTTGRSATDFYYFDPENKDSLQWTELRHISNYNPESYDDGYTNIARYNAVGFVMLNIKCDGGGDRAYITTGSSGSTTWAYNFANDLWNQKTSYERPARSGAIGFTVQNRSFVGLGNNGKACFSNIDEWKPDETYNHAD